MRHVMDVLIPTGDGSGILRAAGWFVGILLLESVIQYYQTWLANRVAQGITLDLRSELFRRIIRFRLSYFDRTPVGQLVTRHISDIDGIAEVFSVGLLDMLRDMLKLVVIIGWMLWMDWKLTLIVLVPVPVLLYATRLFQLAVKKSFQDVRNQVARINVFVQEHVTGMHLIQAFNREEREAGQFEEINRAHRSAHIRSIWAYSVFFPVVELLSAASVSLMIWFGVGEALEGRVSPGLLLEFSMFVTMMYRPIRQMADNINVLQMGVVNAERVFAIFDLDQLQPDEGKYPMRELSRSISFHDTWFAYTGEDWALKGIDLEIRKGEMLAVVGATGAGKSSLAGLLNRFHEVSRGELRVDGIPIAQYRLEDLRRTIAVVPQDVFLFADTVLNNITLLDPAITRDQVIRASMEVGTHDFIMRLPGGYDFPVGERGVQLSTGQRQLIAFVRAYVHNPSVLVLDEATSSVDDESENLLRQAAERLTRGRTSVVIAHRLSTVRHADRIVVLDQGRMAEEGTHDELMKKQGLYARLIELQFGEEPPVSPPQDRLT